MQNSEISPEMRLFSQAGERLYLTAEERAKFLDALDDEEPANRMFCHVLHYTGCRPSEALELTPDRILIDEQSIVFRCLKKRKTDSKGRVKQAQYRSVPVPLALINNLDLVFSIRAKKKQKDQGGILWPMSRPTAYRLVKRVMSRAGIAGKHATGKGLRHGFGVAMVTAKQPVPIHILAQIMGHSDRKTTEIYLQVVGDEKRQMIVSVWDHINHN